MNNSRPHTSPRRTTGCVAAFIVLASLHAAVAHAQPRAYVTNSLSDDVSVIDTSRNQVIATIPVGDNPSGIALTPNGAFAYVTNSNSATISVIDTAAGSVVSSLPVRPGPQAIVIDSAGNRAYLTHPDIRGVTAIDIVRKLVIGTVILPGTPRAIAVSPDGAKLYVGWQSANPPSDYLSVFSTSSGAVTTTIAFPRWFLPGIQSVTLSPDGGFAYVTTYLFQSIYIVNTRTNAIVGFLGREVGGSGYTGYKGSPAVSKDGRSLFLPNFYRPGIDVFDTAGGTAAQTINLASRPEMVAMTADGTVAYVTGSGSAGGEVSAINVASRAVIATIPVGSAPKGIATTPAGFTGQRSIPGRIQAEDFDATGFGYGYFDTTAGNEQGVTVYRPGDVDIKASSEGGFAVGWFTAGEWLAYTATVKTTGLYTIQARVGTPLAGRTFRIEVDGIDVSGPVSVPVMPDWDRYTTVSIPYVYLNAGPRVVRVVMGTADFMEFQWLDFVPQN